MIGRRNEESSKAMIDVTYRQRTGEREVVAILQELYLCASVEFLMAIADFFLQSLPQSSVLTTTSVPSDRLKLRQTTEPRLNANTGIKGGGLNHNKNSDKDINKKQNQTQKT